jgi:hypothetical protein
MNRLLIPVHTLLLLCALSSLAAATTLKEMYDLAPSQGEYDRFIELETGVVYTGGLLIGNVFYPATNELVGGEEQDVRIVGNGAILDLQGEQLIISYCDNRLDIDDCVIINGNIRYRGINTFDHQVQPVGSVRNVTFYQPHDYGVRLQGSGAGITLEWNLVVDVIDTGDEWIYTTGYASSWLPTGTSYAPSGQPGYYGVPVIYDNWTFHSDDVLNDDPLTHFIMLCEYG